MAVYEDERREVYRLALEGKSDEELAEIFRREKGQINKWINELKVPRSPIYNLALYNQIIFERNALRGIVDKDLLEEIIELLNKNFTFVEVAILLNSTEKEVQKTRSGNFKAVKKRIAEIKMCRDRFGNFSRCHPERLGGNHCGVRRPISMGTVGRDLQREIGHWFSRKISRCYCASDRLQNCGAQPFSCLLYQFRHRCVQPP